MANFIKAAVSGSHGQFKRKAQKAGMTTAAYTAKVLAPGSKANALTKKQANLARVLGSFHKN